MYQRSNQNGQTRDINKIDRHKKIGKYMNPRIIQCEARGPRRAPPAPHVSPVMYSIKVKSGKRQEKWL